MELDRIYCSDARAMEELDANSVQLVVTSPPYNVGKNYNFYEDRAPLDQYLELLMQVWRECARVLVPGGRIAVNVANTNRNPYLPLHSFIIQQFLDLKFLMRGEILWDKSACLSGATKVYVRDRRDGLVSCRRLLDLYQYGGWEFADIEAVDAMFRPCWKPIRKLWETEDPSGICFTFTDGSAVTATPDHRFARPDGELVRAKDLRVGDCLRRSPRMPEFEGDIPAAFACEDLAWALGLYLAEGSEGRYTARGMDHFRYHLHKKESLWIERLQNAWEPFGCSLTHSGKGNSLTVTVSGHVAGNIVNEFITGHSARGKLALDSVLRAPRYWRFAFLHGWLDGDGHLEPEHSRWAGNITGANDRLLPVMRALARSLGFRLQHHAGWAITGSKRYGVIRWKLYLEQSNHPRAADWHEVAIQEIRKEKARFFDLSLAEEPHLFVLANGLVSHNSAGVSTAWGSFARASNPVLRDTHEYIMVFSKDTMRLEKPYTRGDSSGIENMEFVEWTRSIWHKNGTAKKMLEEIEDSIWHFATQSKKIRHKIKDVEHPAPFPLDLPMRLILLYTNVNDIVLDPFMGTGSTAIAAALTQRRYIGYDINPDYVEIAEDRIKLYTTQPYIPELAPRRRSNGHKGTRRNGKNKNNK
jgi:DNA modification methylase